MKHAEVLTRKDVLGQTKLLKISPWEAEQWAREHDEPPFASKPAQDEFDPMQLETWTLPMAAAWLIWRSPHAVRDHWDDYRQHWKVWRRIRKPRGRIDQFTCEVAEIGSATLRPIFASPDIRIFPAIHSWDYESPYDRVPIVKAIVDTLPRQILVSVLFKRAKGATGILWNDKAQKRSVVPHTFLRAYYRFLTRGGKLTDDDKKNRDFVAPSNNSVLLYKDIRIERRVVILADEAASEQAFTQREWLTEHVLGWIAYRDQKRFRPLTRENRLSRNTGHPTYPFDFQNVDCVRTLENALIGGELLARPTTESLGVGVMDPIPTGWWVGRALSSAPDLLFDKNHVLSLWPPTNQETTSSKQSLPQTKTNDKLPTRMQNAIIKAVNEIWPNLDDLNFLRIKERDKKIIEHFILKEQAPISRKSIDRTFKNYLI